MIKYKLHAFNGDALDNTWLWCHNKLIPGSKKRVISADIVYREDGLYPSLETIADIYEKGKGDVIIFREDENGERSIVDLDALGLVYVSAYPYRGEITLDKIYKAMKYIRSQNNHLTFNKSFLDDLGISVTTDEKNKIYKSLEQILSEIRERIEKLPRKERQRIIQKYLKEELQ